MQGKSISMLSDEDARERLPIKGPKPAGPLPAWVSALADSLPHTAAALLRLDYLHRAQSPLDPLLRGKMRWVAARTNRCSYGEAYAAADLRRAGLDEAGL